MAQNTSTKSDRHVTTSISVVEEQMKLLHPVGSNLFQLQMDASNSTLGAVLLQNEKPTNFSRRTLNQAELHLPTNEIELLATTWALTFLRNSLFGSHNQLRRNARRRKFPTHD